ncbi:ABL133Cp [Eremothecium gossypii ATCC 10895]|uniref:ABL133Cp n=1 Tax=Eremothecium gossypii (strain ATCC 10895 / CBS 109.51 / FGSC 9923 / NRRL Y-1056) TaxID=284811 RepID=Q75E06_EREGS|nr:ABL133Cp [Eremothecium gossypii ATCC 10895]AAS50638.2 ABL133Cp [Eremothecium gossypii ATCC 10895]
MVDFTFTWPSGPKKVVITGDFDRWQGTVPLEKQPSGDFVVQLPIGVVESDKFYFKFIVDGQWVTSDLYPKDSLTGAENNYVLLSSVGGGIGSRSAPGSAGAAALRAQPAPGSKKGKKKKKGKKRTRRNRSAGEASPAPGESPVPESYDEDGTSSDSSESEPRDAPHSAASAAAEKAAEAAAEVAAAVAAGAGAAMAVAAAAMHKVPHKLEMGIGPLMRDPSEVAELHQVDGEALNKRLNAERSGQHAGTLDPRASEKLPDDPRDSVRDNINKALAELDSTRGPAEDTTPLISANSTNPGKMVGLGLTEGIDTSGAIGTPASDSSTSLLPGTLPLDTPTASGKPKDRNVAPVPESTPLREDVTPAREDSSLPETNKPAIPLPYSGPSGKDATPAEDTLKPSGNDQKKSRVPEIAVAGQTTSQNSSIPSSAKDTPAPEGSTPILPGSPLLPSTPEPSEKPSVKGATPSALSQKPISRDSAPADGSKPSIEKATPVPEGSTPILPGSPLLPSTPALSDKPSVKGATPSSPAQLVKKDVGSNDGSKSATEGSTPAPEGSTPILPGSPLLPGTPVPVGKSSVKDATPSALSQKPISRDSAPGEESKPSTEKATPVPEGSTPVLPGSPLLPSTPVPSDKPFVKGATPSSPAQSVKKDVGSNDGSKSATEYSTPTPEGSTPILPGSPLLPGTPVPVGKPSGQSATPSALSQKPISRDSKPSEESKPSREKATPVPEGSTPVLPGSPLLPSTPVPSDKPSVKGATPSSPAQLVKKDVGSNDGSKSATEYSTPAPEGSTPILPGSPLLPGTPVPVGKSSVKDATPSALSQKPISRDSAPGEESKPSTEKATPVPEGSTPVLPGSPLLPSTPAPSDKPSVKGVIPSGTAPVKKDAKTSDESKPATEYSTPVPEGSTPVLPGSPLLPGTPVPTNKTSTKDVTPSALSQKPTSRDSAPADGSKPSIEKATPVPEGSTPVLPGSPLLPSTPVPSDKPSVKGATPSSPAQSVRKDIGSNDGSKSATEYSTPAPEGSTPILPGSPLLPGTPVPVGKSSVKDATPSALSQKPISRDSAPGEESKPSTEKATPVPEGSTPVLPGSPLLPSTPAPSDKPSVKGVIPSGTTPVKKDAKTSDESKPATEYSTPAPEGSTPILPGSPLLPGTPVPAGKPSRKTATPRSPAQPVKNDTKPSDKSTPATETSTPTPEGSTPILPGSPLLPHTPVASGKPSESPASVPKKEDVTEKKDDVRSPAKHAATPVLSSPLAAPVPKGKPLVKTASVNQPSKEGSPGSEYTTPLATSPVDVTHSLSGDSAPVKTPVGVTAIPVASKSVNPVDKVEKPVNKNLQPSKGTDTNNTSATTTTGSTPILPGSPLIPSTPVLSGVKANENSPSVESSVPAASNTPSKAAPTDGQTSVKTTTKPAITKEEPKPTPAVAKETPVSTSVAAVSVAKKENTQDVSERPSQAELPSKTRIEPSTSVPVPVPVPAGVSQVTPASPGPRNPSRIDPENPPAQVPEEPEKRAAPAPAAQPSLAPRTAVPAPSEAHVTPVTNVPVSEQISSPKVTQPVVESSPATESEKVIKAPAVAAHEIFPPHVVKLTPVSPKKKTSTGSLKKQIIAPREEEQPQPVHAVTGTAIELEEVPSTVELVEVPPSEVPTTHSPIVVGIPLSNDKIVVAPVQIQGDITTQTSAPSTQYTDTYAAPVRQDVPLATTAGRSSVTQSRHSKDAASMATAPSTKQSFDAHNGRPSSKNSNSSPSRSSTEPKRRSGFFARLKRFLR